MKKTSGRPTDEIERIVNTYGDMLYRICILMLQNESDVEDVVQETFIKYYQKAPAFTDAEHEKAWLIRVAANRCKDLLRFRLRHPQIDDETLAKITCETSDSGILEYRLVLTLYYIEEYSVQEIAGIIGRTASAVKMRLQKGRKLLEKVYRKEYL